METERTLAEAITRSAREEQLHNHLAHDPHIDPDVAAVAAENARIWRRWQHTAFPWITISDDLAAALFSTQAPAQSFETLPPLPFEVFGVQIPDFVLPIGFVLLAVWRESPWLSVKQTTGGYQTLIGHNQDDQYDDPDTLALRGFLLNLLTFMTQEHTERMRGPVTGPTRKHVARTHPEKLATTYTIGRAVSVIPGLAAELRATMLGGGTPRTVRWMVRGHWRHQPCGKLSRDRRLTWVKPHWAGDPNAPTLLRPHNIQGQND